MEWASSVYNSAKNKVDGLTGSDIEKLVKEATSNENWGVSGTIKSEIAHYTYDFQGCKEVMGVVWKRMGETGRNWRMVFKSLELLDYLIKNGHERVANMARERQFQIKSLSAFSYFDEDQRDRGAGVREMASRLCELLDDWNKLRELRTEQRKQRKKFKGISNTGFGSSSAGGYGGDDGTKWRDDWRDPAKEEKKYNDSDDSKKKKKKKDKKKKNKKKKVVEEEEEPDVEELTFDDFEDEKPKKKKTKKKNKNKKRNKKSEKETTDGGDDSWDAFNTEQVTEEAPAQTNEFDLDFDFAPAPTSQTTATQSAGDWGAFDTTAPAPASTQNDGWDAFSAPASTATTTQNNDNNVDLLSAFGAPTTTTTNNNSNLLFGLQPTNPNSTQTQAPATNTNLLFDMTPNTNNTNSINQLNQSMSSMTTNTQQPMTMNQQPMTMNQQQNNNFEFGSFSGGQSKQTAKASVKTEPAKKADPWTGNGLVNLDDITQESASYAAFDPNARKKKTNVMPSLSTYGHNKPDLGGFNNNFGRPQMQMNPNMNRQQNFGQNQFQQQPMNPNMNMPFGMNQMNMNQMNMNQQRPPMQQQWNMNNRNNMNSFQQQTPAQNDPFSSLNAFN